MLTCAQNARQSWDWLKNGQIVSDKIQLADLPIQDLALYGRKLRVVRGPGRGTGGDGPVVGTRH
jgi:hypothetical protein